MKKILFVAVFMISALVSNAQISWDVRVGTNVSGIENSDSKMKLGLKAGAGVNYAFNEQFSFRPMLYFTSKGSTEGSSNLGFGPDKTTTLNYLQLPVLASYKIKVTESFSFAPSAGPYVAYRISKDPDNTIVKFEKFDYGVNAGLDFVFKKFVLGVDAEYGIAKLSSNVNKLHNINYSLMLGYKF